MDGGCGPAVRLFHLALKNLSEYGPVRHAFNVAKFRVVTRRLRKRNLAVGLQKKSMVAARAPKLQLRPEIIS